MRLNWHCEVLEVYFVQNLVWPGWILKSVLVRVDEYIKGKDCSWVEVRSSESARKFIGRPRVEMHHLRAAFE